MAAGFHDLLGCIVRWWQVLAIGTFMLPLSNRQDRIDDRGFFRFPDRLRIIETQTPLRSAFSTACSVESVIPLVVLRINAGMLPSPVSVRPLAFQSRKLLLVLLHSGPGSIHKIYCTDSIQIRRKLQLKNIKDHVSITSSTRFVVFSSCIIFPIFATEILFSGICSPNSPTPADDMIFRLHAQLQPPDRP